MITSISDLLEECRKNDLEVRFYRDRYGMIVIRISKIFSSDRKCTCCATINPLALCQFIGDTDQVIFYELDKIISKLLSDCTAQQKICDKHGE